DAAPLRELLAHSETARVTATVDDDPVAVRDAATTTVRVAATAHTIRSGRATVNLSVRVVIMAGGRHAKRWLSLLPGQSLTVTGHAARDDGAEAAGRGKTKRAGGSGGDLVAATVWTRGPPATHGGPPRWQTAAGDLRQGLRDACAGLDRDVGGLLPGLALGDVSRLDPAVAEDFRGAGLTHLTAVSGANVAIVVGGVVGLVAACGAGRRTRVVLGLIALGCLVIVVRPSPSVLRAAVMGGIGLVALPGRGTAVAVPALSAAVSVLIVWDPALATDLGFCLSVAACAGLVFFANRFARAWTRRGWPPWLAQALAVPVAAELAVTPVLAAATGTISLVSVPANLLAAIAVPPATVLVVLATAVAPLWMWGAEALCWLAAWPGRWLIFVAHRCAGVPSGSVGWSSGAPAGLLLALGIAACLVALRTRAGRRLLAVVLLGIVVGVAPVRWWAGPWPPTGWVMVACDVGQGDAIVLPTGDPDTAVVVDAGPRPRPVNQCLRDLGIDHVAMLVVSHFHADHVGGVAGVYQDRRVDRVLIPAYTDPPEGYRRVKTAAHGADLAVAAPGAAYQVGRLRLDVLTAGDGFHGTRSDPNNNSVVMRAEIGGVSLLLAGDVERDAQQALLRSGAALDVDVFKVPHHGSSYFDPAFYEAASPTVAVISVGVDNDYGHPHPSSLRQLRHEGATVLRTDRQGSVAVIGTDHGLEVMAHGHA
ncbi:MAG TPA: ComEC/Rec2 family competence protein, partial [Stackebrandtia sp.]|uniref:ComEC/Rec2 family competence protein n=1 Tax=Stackebrandtia sp. TaxID=2023065 RepID=UPI002D4C3493